MTFTRRQAFIGLALHVMLGPVALAVMPPYTADTASTKTVSASDSHPTNEEVMQVLLENKKLLQELLQRINQMPLSKPDPPKTSSAGD